MESGNPSSDNEELKTGLQAIEKADSFLKNLELVLKKLLENTDLRISRRLSLR